MPPVPEVARTARRCARDGVGFSLVTPVVREGLLDRAAGWLAEAARAVPGVEVVFNDWGLWRQARARGLPVTAVAGRVLGRQRRGPRVAGLIAEGSPSHARALRGSLWDGAEARERLLELGGVRVELDLLVQGTWPPPLPPGVALSVCGPWLPVTVTPACPWTADPLDCSRPCTRHPPVRLATCQNPVPLWSQGNALFLRRQGDPPPSYVARLGADRWVWSPGIPA